MCGERKAFQTAASCGQSLRLQSSKGTILFVIEVVPTVRYGSRHEIFAGCLLLHVTEEDQGVAKLTSLLHCKSVCVHCNVHNHARCGMEILLFVTKLFNVHVGHGKSLAACLNNFYGN